VFFGVTECNKGTFRLVHPGSKSRLGQCVYFLESVHVMNIDSVGLKICIGRS
jgi:hypothetical protein